MVLIKQLYGLAVMKVEKPPLVETVPYPDYETVARFNLHRSDELSGLRRSKRHDVARDETHPDQQAVLVRFFLCHVRFSLGGVSAAQLCSPSKEVLFTVQLVSGGGRACRRRRPGKYPSWNR